VPVKENPYYNKYLKQAGKCPLCREEIEDHEYCVINSPDGVMVIHKRCLSNVRVSGCYAQIEILYKAE